MKRSPIILNNTMRSKSKELRSPSKTRHENSEAMRNSANKSSIHTISVKQSPTHKKSHSNLPQTSQHQPFRQLGQCIPGKSMTSLKSGSPPKNFPPCVQQQSNLNSRVDYSPPRSPLHAEKSSVRLETVSYIGSPLKENDSKILIARNRSPSKITVRPMPPVQRVVKYVNNNTNPQPKELELERKVKILQARIKQIHTEKCQVESDLNERLLRLQHENSVLRQKLSKMQNENEDRIGTPPPRHLQKEPSIITQKEEYGLNSASAQSDQHWAKFNMEMQFTQTQNGQKNSEKILRELEKSEENEYLQSKEIHSLKNSLNEAEDMLSKQISKSLELLEELQERENENQQIKDRLKKVTKRVEQLEQYSTQLQEQKSKLEERNEELLEQISEIKSQIQTREQQSQSNVDALRQELESAHEKMQSYEISENTLLTQNETLHNKLNRAQEQIEANIAQIQQLQQQMQNYSHENEEATVTKQLLTELESNNQLLISTIKQSESKIRTLEASLNDSERRRSDLEQELFQTLNKLNQAEESLVNLQFSQSRNATHQATLIQDLQLSIRQKEQALSDTTEEAALKQTQIAELNEKIQQLEEKLEEAANNNKEGGSTANSFHKKDCGDSSANCSKCDEMRKTIFKLNHHLTKSGGYLSSSNSLSSKKVLA